MAAAATEPGGDAVVGLLLAAGRGTRFDAAGRRDKLLAPYQDGTVAGYAARALASTVDRVLAVVGDDERGRRTRDALGPCADAVLARPRGADTGMGDNLAAGVTWITQHWNARCIVVALGDMPRVRPETIRVLVDAVRHPGDIAAPTCKGRRGHPVVFGCAHFDALRACHGDRGAAALLAVHRVQLVALDDEGVLFDIDHPADLGDLPT